MQNDPFAALASAMNLRHLRLFHQVGVSGTQHGVAPVIGMTQPAISQAIANIEDRLQCRLFERSRHGMRLSELGRVLHDRVGRMLRTLTSMHSWVTDAAMFDNRLKMSQLQSLVEIDRQKGYSAAARHLGLSVPTVHRSARRFSELCGVPLFERVGNTIETTVAGDHLARLAGLALNELEAALVDMDDLAGQGAGSIVLGTMSIARTDILPDTICDICEKNPHAGIELVEANYETLVRRLRRGELDVMLGASRGSSVRKDLEEHIIFDDELSIFARRGHPLTKYDNITVTDLVRYPWIAPPSQSPTRIEFEKLFESHTLQYGLIISSSLAVVRTLVDRSDRLTLLSRRSVLYEEEQGLLSPLVYSLPQTRRKICITVRRDWQPTRFQALFLDQLKSRT